MILPVLLALAAPAAMVAPWAPDGVVIATPRGETRIPISLERGIPAVAAPHLALPLGLKWARAEGTGATVELAGTVFTFEVELPFVRVGSAVHSLMGAPYIARDSLFLPLHWLSELVPRVLRDRYAWDPLLGRLAERPRPPVAAPIAATMGGASAPAAGTARVARTPHPITGLRRSHTVVVDPGHGGRDPGNPGRYFPRGLAEKHVTLAIGRLLRAELERRGLTALLTRATDTLVDLADRGAFCRAHCDLFVSIHVNSLSNASGRRISGVETYFLSAAKTEDQARVARMENDAIRFEGSVPVEATEDLSFILRDLQQNEHLRESARAAELIQAKLGAIHPGGNRGVQQAGFMVLSTASRPAVLIEAGFATHAGDAEFLASALGQRKLVNAVADGIVAYLLEFERKIALFESP